MLILVPTGNGCGPHPTVTIDNVHAGSVRLVFVELGKPPLRSLRHEVFHLSACFVTFCCFSVSSAQHASCRAGPGWCPSVVPLQRHRRICLWKKRTECRSTIEGRIRLLWRCQATIRHRSESSSRCR